MVQDAEVNVFGSLDLVGPDQLDLVSLGHLLQVLYLQSLVVDDALEDLYLSFEFNVHASHPLGRSHDDLVLFVKSFNSLLVGVLFLNFSSD